jgi:hypothetical protein
MQDAGTIAHADGMCTSRLTPASWKPKRHKSDRNGMTANLPDSFVPCPPPAPKLSDDKPPTVIAMEPIFPLSKADRPSLGAPHDERTHTFSPDNKFPLDAGGVTTHERVSESGLGARDSGAPAEKDVLRRVRNTKIYACFVTRTLGGTAFCVDALYRRHTRQHPIATPVHYFQS